MGLADDLGKLKVTRPTFRAFLADLPDVERLALIEAMDARDGAGNYLYSASQISRVLNDNGHTYQRSVVEKWRIDGAH